MLSDLLYGNNEGGGWIQLSKAWRDRVIPKIKTFAPTIKPYNLLLTPSHYCKNIYLYFSWITISICFVIFMRSPLWNISWHRLSSVNPDLLRQRNKDNVGLDRCSTFNLNKQTKVSYRSSCYVLILEYCFFPAEHLISEFFVFVKKKTKLQV